MNSMMATYCLMGEIVRGDGFLLISGVFGGITEFVPFWDIERLQLVIDLYI
jgi:hypothetical protein